MPTRGISTGRWLPRRREDALMTSRRAVFLAAILAWSAGALAQEGDAPAALAGTLAKAKSSGAVTIAHRESSVPFSYVNARGEPIQ